MSSETHVSIDVLYAWEEGDLPQDRARRVQGHVDACPVCRRELEFLREFRQIEPGASLPGRSPELTRCFRERRPAENDPAARSTPRRRGWAAGLLAAAAALVVAGIWQLAPGPELQAPADVYRGPATAVIDARLEATDTGWTFTWSGHHDGDTAATVRVLDAAGRTVLELTNQTSPLRLERSELSATPEELRFIRVTARGPGGQERQSRLIPLD